MAQTVQKPARLSRVRRVADRLGLDLVELACLVVLAGVSLAVLLPLLTRGRPLSGADGLYPADQLQYFTWIREAANHWLIGNRFDLAPGDRPFLHPGFLLTGLVHKVTGIGIPWVYIAMWKPVAIGVLFYGALRYVRRFFPDSDGQRWSALVLALFAVMPAVAIVAWTGWGGKPRQYTFDFITGEMWTGQYLWGYLFTGIAVGLMPLVFLGAERWREGRGSTRTLALAALGAGAVMYLQPWQGATLCGVVVGVEAWRWLRTRERPAWGLAWLPAAAAMPAIYYFLLSKLDESWKLAGEANAAGAQPEWSWPWWAVALTLAPLALPALLALRERAATWQDMAVRLWPLAAGAVYLQPAGTFPYHSLQGIVLPLSVLAVAGVASLRSRGVVLRPAVVVGLLFLMTVPGFAHKLSVAANNIHAGADPYFIFEDEKRALAALEDDPRPGGVLAPLYSGFMLPYTTGRETYVGQFSWAPDSRSRRIKADSLFEGRLTGDAALRFVRSTRARFLFADCRKLADLTAVLRPELERVDRYGCATVYTLRERPYMREAAGPPDS